MPDPVKLSEADKIIQGIRPLQLNRNAPTPVYNSRYAQEFEGLPFNNQTLTSGVLEDLAYTTEGYGSQLAKHAGAALVNTVGFFAATAASIPNFIDNQFNDGNDRIIKPINQMQNAALEDLKVYEPANNSEQSIREYITPSWISGNTKSFWGDVIEQSGIIAGTTLGTGALLGAARLVPGLAMGEAALGNVVKGALSNVLKPTTLLAENLGMSKGIANTINSQKFINGLANATKQVGVNAVQSYTEALFEGLDGEKNFIESKVKEYQTKYGYTPEGKELEEIKNTAEELKNTRFNLNMAGLMISNTSITKAFFPSGVNSWLTRLDHTGQTFDKAGKIVNKELSFLKNTPSYISKPVNFVAARMPLAYSEGLEEVYQMGLEKGLDNYYTNKLNTEDFEANFENISKSLGVGINSVLSKEGLKSFITGAGVGTIFQGVGNYRDKKSLDRFFDETTEYIDPITKEPVKITNREDAVRNLNEIDKSIGDLFSTNPYEQNPVSLNQTLGERIQQFVTDNNNYQDSLKTQGSYLEYDQAQKARFDSLFPYIKKGYKDVIVSKIEGIYQDLNQEGLSNEERQNLSINKQQALQDVDTVEKFTRTVDNVFFEQYGHPILDQAQRQLKDIAAFHLWNIHSLDKQKKELIDIYGDNIFQDEIAKDYKGDNIEALLNKELAKVQPLASDVDPYKQERAILEKIKNSENPTEAYFAYKQKDKTGGFLTSNDFLILKKQREALDKRVFENNSVFQNLQTLKTDPFKALVFMKEYHGKAEAINKEISTKEKEIEQKVENKNLVKKTVAPENVEKVLEKLEGKTSTPISTTEVKEVEEEVKKETKTPEKEVKKEKTLEEKIAELLYSKQQLENNITERIDSFIKNGASLEEATRLAEKEFNDSDREANKLALDKINSQLDALEKSTQKPTEKSPNKPKELRNGEESEANSLTSSKIFSSNTSPTSIQKEIKELEAARDVYLNNDDYVSELAFDMVISDEEARQLIIEQYEEQIQALRNKAALDTGERRLEGNTDGATITSTVLPSSQSNLYYDVGLIRTQLHNGPKEIYTINLKDINGNDVPALTVQNNKDNFLLDIKVLNEFIEEHSQKTDHASKMDILKSLNYTENVPFVKFLEDLMLHPEGEEVFKYIQNNTFTTKSEIEHSEKISQIGSSLKLFNFKYETLGSLHRQLYGENTVYKILSTTPNPSFADISGMLKFNFVNKISKELSGYDVTVVESGAEGLIRIETTSTGKSITKNDALILDDIIKFQEQGSDKNLKDGFYALFKTSRDTFFPVGVRTSQTYTDLSEAGKNSFKLAMYYGKNTDDFYNVEKQADGSFSVKNTSKEGVEVYKDFDTFAKWVEETRLAKNATVSFLENNKSTLDFLFNKARVNYKGFKNNFVKVDFILPVNIEDNIIEEKMKVEKTNLNEILDQKDSGNQSEIDSEPFEITFYKNGESETITNTEIFEGIKYIINSNVKKGDIETFISNSKKRNISSLLKEIFDNFYSTTPSYSTISEYQINKIKEFIEKC